MRLEALFAAATLFCSAANSQVLECVNGGKIEFTNATECPNGFKPKRALQLNESYPPPPANTPRTYIYNRNSPTYSRPLVIEPPRRALPSCEELRTWRDYYMTQMDPKANTKIRDLFTKLRDVQDKMTQQDCRI